MNIKTSSRQVVTTLLIVGSVIFGMVLAGGLELSAPAVTGEGAAPSPASPGSVSSSSVEGLTNFADLAEMVAPSVVAVTATTISTAPQGRRRMIDPFEFFFGPRWPREGPESSPEQFRSQSGGSGFLISSDGLVVTNHHVVDGATTVTVHLNDRTYEAEVKGTDPPTDIALLKIGAGNDLTYLRLGDSDALRVGDWVMAIGNPLHLDKTVTVGVVSAKGRRLNITDPSFENFIQTDAAINFGNSGGPLVNTRGEVVGIATAINWGAENIGFAVPVNILKNILPQLKEKGAVSRGYLGVAVENLDFKRAQAFGLPAPEGALVVSVQPGTPAAEADLQHGDIILTVDGRKIQETRDLIEYVSAQGPRATVTLEILRDGKRLEKKVQLAERPQGQGETAPAPREREGAIEWLGLQYQDITPGVRSMFRLPGEVTGVVVVRVAPASPLLDEGVQRGDIIVEVNGRPVGNVVEFEQRVRSADSGSFLRFYVQRYPGGSTQAQSFFAFVRVP